MSEGQYPAGFYDVDVIEELKFMAFQRHQDHKNPLRIDLVRGTFLLFRIMQQSLHFSHGGPPILSTPNKARSEFRGTYY